jgi:hypothetical protein
MIYILGQLAKELNLDERKFISAVQIEYLIFCCYFAFANLFYR